MHKFKNWNTLQKLNEQTTSTCKNTDKSQNHNVE